MGTGKEWVFWESGGSKPKLARQIKDFELLLGQFRRFAPDAEIRMVGEDPFFRYDRPYEREQREQPKDRGVVICAP